MALGYRCHSSQRGYCESMIVFPFSWVSITIISDTLISVPPPGLPRIEGLENAVIEPSSLNLAILTVPHDVDRARIKCAVGPSNPLVPIKW